VMLHREFDLRIRYTRPIELRKVHGLPWIGRVGHGHCIATATMKSLVVMQGLGADLATISLLEVLPHFPVEGRFQGILDSQRST